MMYFQEKMYDVRCIMYAILITVLQTLPGKAQIIKGDHFVVNVGLHIALGTHFDRLGLSFQGYTIFHNNYQLNTGLRFYYNFRNIGPAKKYFEFVPSLGIVFSFGEIDSTRSLFIGSISNQTERRNSIGYSYNYYVNNISSSQGTGILSFQFGNFQFITENDLFAFSVRDEFRTGSALVQLNCNKFQYGLNFTGWTGTRGTHVDDPDFPSPNGYMDMSKTMYGLVATGLLSGQVLYASPHGQILQASIGMDAEQARNFFQNKLIHDLFFKPKNGEWRGGSHLPMIDTNGNMYLYRKNQKIRPAKLFLNLFSNPSLFY